MGQALNDSLLPSLPENILAALFAEAEQIHLSPGQALFHGGDQGDGCYELVEGVVKVVITSSQANERIIAILGAGSFLGELSMLDSLPRSASIIAIKECRLLFVTRDRFRQYARQHPELFEHLTAMLAKRLRETDELLAATSFLSVKARLARALLELGKHLGKDVGDGQIEIAHRISQSELAAMACIARENVARTMSEWKKRNIVTRPDQHYRINNVVALERETELDNR